MLYPPAWDVSGQNVSKVVFEFEPYGVASIELVAMGEAYQAKIGDQDAIDATARYAIEDQKGENVVKNVEKGVWPYAPTGHFALLDLQTKVGLPTQRLYVACPLGDRHVVMAQLIQVNGKVTEADRVTLSKAIASVRPAGWGAQPGPIAIVRPTSTPLGTPQVFADKAVNFRAGPGTTYPTVGSAKAGQSYDIVGRNADNSWYLVCCVGDKPAWVAASVVQALGDLNAVEVAKNIPTPPPAPTPAPTVPPAPKLGLHGRQTIGSWEIQQERVHKEKAVYWYGDATVAMGNYAIVIVLAKNLASGTDDLARTLILTLRDDKGRVYGYSAPLTPEREANLAAAWQFVVHPTPFTDINPGVETPLIMVWDVKEDVQSLTLRIGDGKRWVEWDLGDFANIPPYKK